MFVSLGCWCCYNKEWSFFSWLLMLPIKKEVFLFFFLYFFFLRNKIATQNDYEYINQNNNIHHVRHHPIILYDHNLKTFPAVIYALSAYWYMLPHSIASLSSSASCKLSGFHLKQRKPFYTKLINAVSFNFLTIKQCFQSTV